MHLLATAPKGGSQGTGNLKGPTGVWDRRRIKYRKDGNQLQQMSSGRNVVSSNPGAGMFLSHDISVKVSVIETFY